MVGTVRYGWLDRYGVVGQVWYGMVWYGMVWLVRYSQVWLVLS